MKSLNEFQRKAISIFMEKFGIDAGIEIIADYEKYGSLGKAMLNYKHNHITDKETE